VAGAPAAILSPLNYYKHSWDVQTNFDASGKPILTVSKLQVLHNAVMKACDILDGAADGLLLDPRACSFEPATLQCPNDVDAASCLTKAQIAGGQVYGSDLGWEGGLVSPTGNFGMDKVIAYSFVGYLSMPLDKQNMKLGALDVKFTPAAFNSIRSMASVYDATNPDLSKFQTHGGKLILYHGFSDPSIVPPAHLPITQLWSNKWDWTQLRNLRDCSCFQAYIIVAAATVTATSRW
jgi:tannase/feruloyl esterase